LIGNKAKQVGNTVSGLVRGSTPAANTVQQAAPAVQQTFRLGSNNIQHISNRHIPSVFSNQVPNLNDTQLANALSSRTFFNPNWSQAQVVEAVERGFNMLKRQGLTGNIL